MHLRYMVIVAVWYAIAGCGGGNSSVSTKTTSIVGTWIPRSITVPGDRTYPCPANVTLSLSLFYCQPGGVYVFRADGTFGTQVDPNPVAILGTYTLTGSTLSLAYTGFFNLNGPMPTGGTLSGNTLTTTVPTHGPASFTFVLQKQ